MSIRTRILLVFLLVNASVLYYLADWVLEDLRPRYLEAVEESMNDQAHVLASLVESQMRDARPNVEPLRAALRRAGEREFAARIYAVTKTRVTVSVYVVDAAGIVVFDSTGRDVGQDYSLWRDVWKSLRGEYGARSTRADKDDASSSTLYVAAPIYYKGRIVGALSVGKPVDSVTPFMQLARQRWLKGTALAAVALLVIALGASLWISRPLRRFGEYVRRLSAGERPPPPEFGRTEIGRLATAFEELRTELEGRKYVEEYVQSLTHEIKSPLASIRAATELLLEDPPAERRVRFLRNVVVETERIDVFIRRLLELAAVERRVALDATETVELSGLARECVAAVSAMSERRGVRLQLNASNVVTVRGEAFALSRALVNVLENAVDFAPRDSTVRVVVYTLNGVPCQLACVEILDEGPGIPEYARERIFERFYSLARPECGADSEGGGVTPARHTGLGLPFARQVARLHGGELLVENRADGPGVRARLRLPLRGD